MAKWIYVELLQYLCSDLRELYASRRMTAVTIAIVALRRGADL